MTRRFERFRWLRRPSVGATGELRNLRVIEIGLPWIDRLSRWSAWIVLGFVALVVFVLLPEPERAKLDLGGIKLILGIYFAYIVLLEAGSRALREAYDLLPVRLFRLVANLTVVSALIFKSGGAESYFWCLYAVPLFQANMYLRRRNVLFIYVLIFALYWTVSSRFLATSPRAFGLLLTNTLTLVSMAILLYWLFGAARAHRKIEKQNIARLELLSNVSVKMTYASNLRDNLMTILREALSAISADNGSMMIADPKTGALKILAWIVDNKEVEIESSNERNDGIAAEVARTHTAINCTDTQNDARFVKSKDRVIRSILSVPIVRNESLTCIINVDSPEPNRFKDEDVKLLASLEEHVGTMIESLQLGEIVLSLSSLPLDQLQSNIVESAFTLVRGDIVALHLEDSEGSINRVATYPPHQEKTLTTPRTDGLTRAILKDGQNRIINDVKNDNNVKPELKAHVKSLIAIPLLTTGPDDKHKAIGVLFVFCKARWAYGPSERQILESLTRQAASAIIQRRLHDAVAVERDFQKRLLSSAFDAIIAVNRKGIVTEFNTGAENLLGYSKDEALKTKVNKYYRLDSDAEEVLDLLLDPKNKGRVINHYTYAKAKNGEVIPIRLSASRLEDGSVGFFRDMREIEKMQQAWQLPRLAADERPSDIDNLKKMLETTTKGAKETLQTDAAWIYYYDHEKKAFQTPPTKYPADTPTDIENSLLSLARKLFDSNEVLLVEMANQTAPTTGPTDQSTRFDCFAGAPLTTKKKTLGVMILGYVKAVSFDNNKQNLIRNYVSDAAIKLEEAQERAQKRALWDGFYKTSLGLTTEVSFDAALQNILDFAVEATTAKFGALGIVSPTEQIKPFVASGVKPELKEHLKHPTGKGLLGRLFKEDEVINAENIEKSPYFSSYGSKDHPTITSFLGAPINLEGKGVGNIYVSNKKGAAKFSDEDQDVLRVLGNLAAGAVKSFNERKYATAKEAITVASVLLSQFAYLAGEERKDVMGALQALGASLTDDAKRRFLEKYLNHKGELESAIGATKQRLAEGFSKDILLEHLLLDIVRRRRAETGIRIETEITQACRVRGNEFMLERACTILLDMAILAIQKTGRQDGQITVACHVVDGSVRGAIIDNGAGVSKEIKSDLFVNKLGGRDRNNSAFLVGWILRAHEGDIAVTKTDSSGTSVDFWIPEASN